MGAGGAEAGGLVVLRAELRHLEGMVRCLEDDTAGGHDEGWEPAKEPFYRAAFGAIDSDPDAVLLVAEREGAVLAMAQLALFEVLSGHGVRRAELVSLFVRAHARGQGVGAVMVRAAIDWARGRGATSMHLTSNKRRLEAHRFYERLGFARSHEGFKLPLGRT